MARKMNENMKFPDGTVLSGQIRISGHFCTIKNLSGSIPEDTSLIRLQTAAGAVYGKIEGYTTVYQALEDGVILLFSMARIFRKIISRKS